MITRKQFEQDLAEVTASADYDPAIYKRVIARRFRKPDTIKARKYNIRLLDADIKYQELLQFAQIAPNAKPAPAPAPASEPQPQPQPESTPMAAKNPNPKFKRLTQGQIIELHALMKEHLNPPNPDTGLVSYHDGYDDVRLNEMVGSTCNVQTIKNFRQDHFGALKPTATEEKAQTLFGAKVDSLQEHVELLLQQNVELKAVVVDLADKHNRLCNAITTAGSMGRVDARNLLVDGF